MRVGDIVEVGGFPDYMRADEDHTLNGCVGVVAELDDKENFRIALVDFPMIGFHFCPLDALKIVGRTEASRG